MGRDQRKAASIALGGWFSFLLLAWWLYPLAKPNLKDASPDKTAAEQKAELTRLQQEIVFLRQEMLLSNQSKDELQRLQSLIKDFRLQPARLLNLPDINPHRHSALIDIGLDQGIGEGMGVICAQGLVGKVESCSQGRSRILFADDPSFRVRFTLANRLGEGIAAGKLLSKKEIEFRKESNHGNSENSSLMGLNGRGYLQPLFFRESFNLQVDEQLYCPGGDGLFPRGLLIGQVETVADPQNLSRISWCVQPSHLKNLYVLVPLSLDPKKEQD